MMKATVFVLLFSFLGLAGCVQMPTTTSTTVDNRPQLSFIAASDNVVLSEYKVWVDGLESGLASDYKADSAALRLLPGSHVIELKRNEEVILKEKIYLGDGVTKQVVVN
ncbi:hypothetical protein OAG1_31230 [Agarivorans sp. OAG1]|uniref:hypothetical protein n=1 Tax=Agarivorans sp. OAG1 TaxID=3082387 RepID=UPI002B2F0481|nr:hypothetical protein OAG1_31230 [Agarivorans sp. OAG1]